MELHVNGNPTENYRPLSEPARYLGTPTDASTERNNMTEYYLVERKSFLLKPVEFSGMHALIYELHLGCKFLVMAS